MFFGPKTPPRATMARATSVPLPPVSGQISVRRSGRRVAPVDLAAPRKDEARRTDGPEQVALVSQWEVSQVPKTKENAWRVIG